MNIIENLNESNCNYRIDLLTKIMDTIGSDIDKNIVLNNFQRVEELETEYNEQCYVMNKLTEFRRTHNCAIVGDSNYVRN